MDYERLHENMATSMKLLVTWKKAMPEEYDALIQNKTWHLVPPSSTKKLIDCKWVYHIKRRANGSINRYKSQLVSKGFKQR